MQKFDLDFSQLSDIVIEKPIEKLPVRGNENRMIRVAFDLFRLDGNNREDLWQVQADDDGNEFLVRTYNLPGEEDNIEKSSDWDVLLDKKGSNFTVAFKGVPIKKLVASEYNVNNKEEAILFREVILRKIAIDESFQNLLLGQPLNQKNEKCPCDCQGGGLGEPGLLPQMDGVILFVDENKKDGEVVENEKEDSPSEDYTDADNWWENLSEKDKDELFDKFKDAPSITKEQAFKIVNMELKLAKR